MRSGRAAARRGPIQLPGDVRHPASSTQSTRCFARLARGSSRERPPSDLEPLRTSTRQRSALRTPDRFIGYSPCLSRGHGPQRIALERRNDFGDCHAQRRGSACESCRRDCVDTASDLDGVCSAEGVPSPGGVDHLRDGACRYDGDCVSVADERSVPSEREHDNGHQAELRAGDQIDSGSSSTLPPLSRAASPRFGMR